MQYVTSQGAAQCAFCSNLLSLSGKVVTHQRSLA